MLSQLWKYAHWFWWTFNGKPSSFFFHILLKCIFFHCKVGLSLRCLSVEAFIFAYCLRRVQGGTQRPMFNLFHLFWNRQIVLNCGKPDRGSLRVHFIRAVTFPGFPADLVKSWPHTSSRVNFNNKHQRWAQHSKSIAGLDLDLCSKDKSSVHGFQMESRKRLLTSHGKKHQESRLQRVNSTSFAIRWTWIQCQAPWTSVSQCLSASLSSSVNRDNVNPYSMNSLRGFKKNSMYVSLTTSTP